MSTVISYERTDTGILLILSGTTTGTVTVPLTHEERKSIGFFLLEISE